MYPRRILFVTHSNEWIGPNASLLELVTRLPSTLHPIVLVPGNGPFCTALAREEISHIAVRRFDKWSIPHLVRTIQSEAVELVYGNSSSGAARNTLVAAKICGVPFIYHLREMATLGRPARDRLFTWADGAIAVSSATAESYRNLMRSPPHVVHNGVTLERFDLDAVECRRAIAQEFGCSESAPLLIHVGNVYPRKGQMLAVEAMRELDERMSGVRMLMAGRLDRDEAYVRDLRTSIRDFGLQDRVFVSGLRSDIARLLAGSDALLHTATEDPHPRAVIEAMAAGIPVVALNVNGVGESVVHGATGYLVPPPGSASALADWLVPVLSDPGLRAELGSNGRQRAAEHFSADRTAEKVAVFVLSLLESA